MTEVQSWVLIGLFATLMLGVVSWQTVSLARTIRTEVGRLEVKMDGKFEALDSKFSTKLDHLDRDVQYLMNRQFREPTDRDE